MKPTFFSISWNDIIEITWEKLLIYVLIGLIVFLVYVIKTSAPAYLSKKGQNLADKQDIQTLTTLVKEVEEGFNDRAERIKQQLDINKEVLVSLHSYEIQAIIQYNQSLHTLYEKLDDLDLDGINMESTIELKNHSKQMWKYYEDVTMKRADASLFIEDQDLIIMANNVFSVLFKEKFGLYNKYIISLQDLLIDYQSYEAREEWDPYYLKRSEISNTYKSDLIEINNKIIPLFRDLAHAFRAYLKKNIA